MDLRQPGGQSSCATRDRIHARKCACMRKHQSRGWRSNRVGRNYNVFREHYKQLGSPLVCAEFDADNFDRVTAKVQDWVASQSTKRNAKYDEPSPRRRWNAQSRTCRHTKLATLLTLK
jgi:hypothetical protein